MFFGFSVLDIAVAIVFLLSVIIGAGKGFLRMTFSFVRILISYWIAWTIYQPVSLFLRESTPIYELLKAQIISSLSVYEVIENYIHQGENAVLSSLPLPQMILDRLAENNTAVVRMMMGVTTLEEYIGSFLAVMCINIIAMVLVFIVAIILTNLVANVLQLISRLPVIRTFDRLGGFLVGAIIGGFAVWAVVTLYITLFASMGWFDWEVFSGSYAGQFLYEHGFLMTRFINAVYYQ